ncbi:MAG TPA: PA14 domain-containing protein, partial [Verrucomicrobiae bacterium]
DITVVQNNSTATAVKENKLGITAVNFWKDSSNSVAGISSDHKASLILRNDGNELDIGVSDPTQTNAAGINVELSTSVSAILSADAGVSVLQTSPLKLWFNTSNTCGATLRARFAVPSSQTNSLLPVADAYVQNGTSSANNFGDASTLAVKLGGASLTRETYMRFDLSSISGTIVSANLRLVTRSLDEPIYHALARVPDNSWIESNAGSITWNTRPASDGPFTVWQVTGNNQTFTVPITTLAQQALSGDGILSFRIFSTGTNSTGPASGGGFVSYGSKENSTANRPQLLITSVRTPPIVRLSSPEDGTVLNTPATVTLTAEAHGTDGAIRLVEFYSGTTRVGQLLNPPYTMPLANLAAGNYTFTAVATEDSGLTATSGPVCVSVYVSEPAGRGTGLVGEYYNGKELKNLVFTRTDPTVNFNWFQTNPVPDVHFSVRWMGKLQAQRAGLHQFHADTDDGARVWIDGRLVIDNWNTHPPYEAEYTGSISLVPGRYYDITMEYFDDVFSAVARLYWTQPGGAKEIIPPSQLYPADQGLRATYFYDAGLSTKAFTRIDGAVNFVWNTNSPDPTSLIGTYGARWTGKIKANAGGQYQFFTSSDDAVRLWVNGQLIINNWAPHALTEDSASITLPNAGQFYDVTMEYFNAAGAGTAILSWQPPGESKQVIPTSNLTPHQNNNPPILGFVANQIAARNSLLTFTASATDPDAGQALTYSLDAGAPAGATIHLTTGAFSWTPSNSQSFGPCNVTLRVTDNGSPQMTDAQTFTITVLTNPPLSFARSGSVAVLTWPQAAGGVQLYSATNLTPPVTWRIVTNAAVLSNGQWSVQIPALTNSTHFFQLQTP